MKTYPLPEKRDQTPLVHPPYAGTVRRAPAMPPVPLPHTLSELTGPLYGRNPIGVNSASSVLLVSDLCTMEPERETKEFMVTSLHPGVTREQVTQSTAWPVRFANGLRETEPPSAAELDALRELNARTARSHAGANA